MYKEALGAGAHSSATSKRVTNSTCRHRALSAERRAAAWRRAPPEPAGAPGALWATAAGEPRPVRTNTRVPPLDSASLLALSALSPTQRQAPTARSCRHAAPAPQPVWPRVSAAVRHLPGTNRSVPGSRRRRNLPIFYCHGLQPHAAPLTQPRPHAGAPTGGTFRLGMPEARKPPTGKYSRWSSSSAPCDAVRGSRTLQVGRQPHRSREPTPGPAFPATSRSGFLPTSNFRDRRTVHTTESFAPFQPSRSDRGCLGLITVHPERFAGSPKQGRRLLWVSAFLRSLPCLGPSVFRCCVQARVPLRGSAQPAQPGWYPGGQGVRTAPALAPTIHEAC